MSKTPYDFLRLLVTKRLQLVSFAHYDRAWVILKKETGGRTNKNPIFLKALKIYSSVLARVAPDLSCSLNIREARAG